MEDKTFELLTKMHSELTGKLSEMDERFTGKLSEVDERFAGSLGELTGRLDKMDERFTGSLGELTGRLDGIDNKITEMGKDIKGLKNDVIRLENKLDTNSKALFDGYHQTYNKLVEVEDKLDGISDKVDRQEVEIKVIKGGKA